MICKTCRKAADAGMMELHEKCSGETHCDCQHQSTEKYPVEKATTCGGFPDNCPELVTVSADPPRTEGGVRCACHANSNTASDTPQPGVRNMRTF